MVLEKAGDEEIKCIGGRWALKRRDSAGREERMGRCIDIFLVCNERMIRIGGVRACEKECST